MQSEKPEELMEGGPESDNEDQGREADSNRDSSGNSRDSEDGAEEKGCGEDVEYEFTRWEERVLEVSLNAPVYNSDSHCWVS